MCQVPMSFWKEKKKKEKKRGLFPLEAALKILVYKNYMPVNLEKC